MPDDAKRELDMDALHALVGTMLGDLGGATSVPLVRLGDRLGFYTALAERTRTSHELAEACGCDERYVREWLAAQAASGYVEHHPAADGPPRFGLSPEQAMVFANEDSPANLMGGFDLVKAMLDSEEQVEAAFRSGGGVSWGELGCVFCAAGRFFRPAYTNHLVQEWIPSLDGVEGALNAGGACVADIGCGRGFSTLVMARAYPDATFVGYDFHEPSIEEAREHALAHGLEGRVTFETTTAEDAPGDHYDLVTCFDCLHDMGDPAGVASHIRAMLKPGGSWMVVEPIAGDTLADNLNPVGRLFYNASTMVCVPTSKAQQVGAALGAQAGEKTLRELMLGAGFSSVRRTSETPVNMVLEAKA